METTLLDGAVTGDTTALVVLELATMRLVLEGVVLLKVVVVSEQGTTVVTVASRVIVYVVLEVKGQLVTLEGHCVMVSVIVDSIVEVVKDGDEEVVPFVGDTTVDELVVVMSGLEVDQALLTEDVVGDELVGVTVDTIDVEIVDVTVESE